MSGRDYVDTLKDGIHLVGKIAAKGVSQISKQIKRDREDPFSVRHTGLYFQRPLVLRRSIIPLIEYYESVSHNRLSGGFVKNLVRSSSDRYFIEACLGIFYGFYPVALDRLKQLLASDPQYTDGYFLQGAIHLNLSSPVEAAESFSKGRLLPHGLGEKLRKFVPTFRLSMPVTQNLAFLFYPDVVGLNLLLAISLRCGGRLIQAIETLEQILSVMPNTREIMFFLALFYYEGGYKRKLVDLLKDLEPKSDLDILILEFLIKVWQEEGKFSLAEGVIQRAFEIEGVESYIHADLKMLMAEVSEKTGRKGEASAYKLRVKKEIPNYASLFERLGINKVGAEEKKEPSLEDTVKVKVSTKDLPTSSSVEDTKGVEPLHLHLVSKDGRVNVLLPSSLIIGREEGDLVLSWDASVSRRHARVFIEKGQVWVEDLGSTNGTWINNFRVEKKRVLNKGDVLLIGNTQFYLEG